MKIKERYPLISGIIIEVTANPCSEFSTSYTKSLFLSPEDELKVVVSCPNGSCTNKYVVFSSEELQNAIALMQNVGKRTFYLEKLCDGWEDRERIGLYHCNSEIFLKGRLQSRRRA